MIDLNEIKNQHVHLFWAMIATGLVAKFYCDFLFTGLIIGVFVEAYQLAFKKEGLKLSDRFLDILFWSLGSPIMLYIMK